MKRYVGKKRLAFILVAVCLVGLIGIGISYSYYLANISTSNEENKNSDISSATITQVVMDMQGKVSSNGAYPGHKMVKEVVVRGIGESNSLPANASIQITPDLGDFASDVTWKLYKSEDAITCSSTLHKEGNIYEESTCNIPSSATLELEGAADNAYKNIVVKPNTETKYYLVIEYANKETDQSNQMGKSFNIDIGLSEYKKPNALKSIIASVDKTGKCPTINSDRTVNVTSAESTDGYVCSATDAYGTSYYYRGNVTNNYVKFGTSKSALVYGYYSDTSSSRKEYDSLETCQNASLYNKKCTVVREKNAPMYWRIVRINGDNTVRVIYDGTSAHANGESSTDRQIGESVFNGDWKKDNVQEITDYHGPSTAGDNAGIGYMYGNRDTIVELPSLSFFTSVDNTDTYYIAKECTFDESTRKFTLKDPIAVLGSDLTNDYVGYYTFLDSNASYSDYKLSKIFSVEVSESGVHVEISDVVYGTSSKEVAQTNINDSTIKTYLDNWYKTNISGTENEQYLADNIFCNDRSFASNNSGTGAGVSETYYNWGDWHASKSTLKCPQRNDAFTVSDTTNGNGALTYPIGLITTDEAVLAGGWSAANNGYYLYSGSRYWTSSPEAFRTLSAVVSDVGLKGFDGSGYVYNIGGVRPVLNLSLDVLQNGDGTMNNPYQP